MLKKKSNQQVKIRGGIIDRWGAISEAIKEGILSLITTPNDKMLRQRTDMKTRLIHQWAFLDALTEEIGQGPLSTFVESFDDRAIAGNRNWRSEMTEVIGRAGNITQIPPIERGHWGDEGTKTDLNKIDENTAGAGGESLDEVRGRLRDNE